MLKQHVLPRLDVLDLEVIALEAVLREGVLRDVIAQPEAQVLADRDELQGVLLELPPHDDEGLVIEVVDPQRAGQRGRHHFEPDDLAALKKLAAVYLGASIATLEAWFREGELREVTCDGEEVPEQDR